MQVFRAAIKAHLVGENTKLVHVGFGTMNGKDGKPFKTRQGGVMRLETLLDQIKESMVRKIAENKNVREEDADGTAEIVSLSAIKYGDLSNQASKDYVFDEEKFTAFEGNTGPYILYTIVRIKSILAKYGAWETLPIALPANEYAKELMLTITKLAPNLETALRTSSPNVICGYIYELSGAVNKFYHETRILTEEDKALQAGYISLIALAKRVLETCIDLLGFSAPEKM